MLPNVRESLPETNNEKKMVGCFGCVDRASRGQTYFELGNWEVRNLGPGPEKSKAGPWIANLHRRVEVFLLQVIVQNVCQLSYTGWSAASPRASSMPRQLVHRTKQS